MGDTLAKPPTSCITCNIWVVERRQESPPIREVSAGASRYATDARGGTVLRRLMRDQIAEGLHQGNDDRGPHSVREFTVEFDLEFHASTLTQAKGAPAEAKRRNPGAWGVPR